MYYDNFSDVNNEYYPNYANLNDLQKDRMNEIKTRTENIKDQQRFAEMRQNNLMNEKVAMQNRQELMNNDMQKKSQLPGPTPYGLNQTHDRFNAPNQNTIPLQKKRPSSYSKHDDLISLPKLGYDHLFNPTSSHQISKKNFPDNQGLDLGRRPNFELEPIKEINKSQTQKIIAKKPEPIHEQPDPNNQETMKLLNNQNDLMEQILTDLRGNNNIVDHDKQMSMLKSMENKFQQVEGRNKLKNDLDGLAGKIGDMGNNANIERLKQSYQYRNPQMGNTRALVNQLQNQKRQQPIIINQVPQQQQIQKPQLDKDQIESLANKMFKRKIKKIEEEEKKKIQEEEQPQVVHIPGGKKKKRRNNDSDSDSDDSLDDELDLTNPTLNKNLMNINNNPNNNNSMNNPMMSMMMMNMMMKSNPIFNNKDDSSSSSDDEDLYRKQQPQQPPPWQFYYQQQMMQQWQMQQQQMQQSSSLPQLPKKKPKKKKRKFKDNKYKPGYMSLPPIVNNPIHNPGFQLGGLGENLDDYVPAKKFASPGDEDVDTRPKDLVDVPNMKMPEDTRVVKTRLKDFCLNLKKMRRWAWAYVYGQSLPKHYKKLSEAKKKLMNEYYTNDKIAIYEQAFLMVKDKTLDLLSQIAEEKTLDMDFTRDGLTEKEQSNMLNLCMDRLVPIMEVFVEMSKMSKKKDFENPIVLSFMSNAFLDHSFPPDNHFSSFVYDRQEFSSTGCLKNQTPEKFKMCVGEWILIRALVNQLFNRTFKYLKDKTSTFKTYNNLKAMGSIVYHTFAWHYKNKLEGFEDNDTGSLIKAKKNQFYAHDGLNEGNVNPDEHFVFDDEDDIIVGMPHKDDMEAYYNDQDAVDVMHELVEEFLTNMYEQATFNLENEKLKSIEKKIENRIQLVHLVEKRWPKYALQLKNDIAIEAETYHLEI